MERVGRTINGIEDLLPFEAVRSFESRKPSPSPAHRAGIFDGPGPQGPDSLLMIDPF